MSLSGFDFGPFMQMLATFGGICGTFGLFAFWQASLLRPFRDELDANPATRHDAARRLIDRRWWGPYRQALGRALAALDRWMGAPEQWGRGFLWCLALAFAYPAITLLIAWGSGVDASIGNWILLRHTGNFAWWQRVLVVIWLVALAVVVATSFNSTPVRFAALVVALVGFAAKASDAVGPRGIMIAGIIAVAIAVGGALLEAIVIVRALAVAVLLAAFYWLVDGGLHSIELNAIALFWFVLPWLNASFDLISWQVSRRLGRRLLRQLENQSRSWSRKLWDNAVTHVIVDVATAVLLLAGLAWALPAVIRLYNRFIRFVESLSDTARSARDVEGLVGLGSLSPVRFPELEWLRRPLVLDDYLCTAAQDPLGAGVWATVMLISTLVPTLVHLGFVFASPFIAMFKPHPVWDARAAHLEGKAPPPAIDLRGMSSEQRAAYDPRSEHPGLAEDGTPWLPPLHPEVTKKVAWELKVAQPLLQLMMVFAAALLVLNLVLAWDLILTPVPAWLLWAAHGFDWTAVEACPGIL